MVLQATIKVMLLAVLMIGTALVTRQGVDCNSNGAPSAACDNLLPSQSAHGNPQTIEVPYSIDLSPFEFESTTSVGREYNPDQTYTCKLLIIVLWQCKFS